MLDILSMGTLNSKYGPRNVSVGSKNHKGIDLGLYSDNIPSIANGTVEKVGYSSGNGYYVYIRNDDGYLTQYLHMASQSTLQVGQKVGEGQTIGIQGSTGQSTGKHLHLGVKDPSGNYVNPLDYLEGATGTTTYGSMTSTSSGILGGLFDGIVESILKFTMIFALVGVSAVFLLQAFGVNLRSVGNTAIKVATKGKVKTS